MQHDGRSLLAIPANWFRLISPPKRTVRLLLDVPDSLPIIDAIRLAPLHVGLCVVRSSDPADIVAQGPFDVVMSTRPSMLYKAGVQAPTTGRVWVVDPNERRETAWRSAHHVLSWHASLSDLTAVIDSVLNGAGVPDLALPKNKDGKKPAIPSVFRDVLLTLDDPNASWDDIQAVLTVEPVFRSRVLEVVNSPFFNLPVRVRTLDRAFERLGTHKLRSAMLAGLCFGAINGVDFQHVRRLRQRGLKAMTLIRKISGAHDEVSASAAVLMDIGKLLMMRTDPDYAQLVVACSRSGTSLVEAEQAHYGFTHAYLGARLLHHWGLPDELVHAVAYSHTAYPLPRHPRSPRMLLFLASELIEASEMGRPLAFDPDWLAETGWAECVPEWQEFLADTDLLAIAC